jgi:hypothetical protein
LGKIEGGAPQERHGLLAVFLSRLENWKEIEYGHPVGDVPIQKAAAIFQKDQSVLLAWLRAGMPHAKAGDWQTGEGFVIRMAWAMEWSALVLHTGRAFGNHEFLDRLSLLAESKGPDTALAYPHPSA